MVSHNTSPGSQQTNTHGLELRDKVFKKVHQAFEDPNQRTNDMTIMAVLQLLCADMISADALNMRIHESGLLSMIQERGGLEELGGNGDLASTITK